MITSSVAILAQAFGAQAGESLSRRVGNAAAKWYVSCRLIGSCGAARRSWRGFLRGRDFHYYSASSAWGRPSYKTQSLRRNRGSKAGPPPWGSARALNLTKGLVQIKRVERSDQRAPRLLRFAPAGTRTICRLTLSRAPGREYAVRFSCAPGREFA